MKAVIAPLACLALASARLLPPREERPARALPAARDELPCGTPTTRGKVEFPDGMIVGGAGDFAMYSGYVNVTETDYLFYWLFEAQTNADDAPLVVWSNGGPGCSAMEGATTEISPLRLFDIKKNYQSATGCLATTHGRRRPTPQITTDSFRLALTAGSSLTTRTHGMRTLPFSSSTNRATWATRSGTGRQ